MAISRFDPSMYMTGSRVPTSSGAMTPLTDAVGDVSKMFFGLSERDEERAKQAKLDERQAILDQRAAAKWDQEQADLDRANKQRDLLNKSVGAASGNLSNIALAYSDVGLKDYNTQVENAFKAKAKELGLRETPDENWTRDEVEAWRNKILDKGDLRQQMLNPYQAYAEYGPSREDVSKGLRAFFSREGLDVGSFDDQIKSLSEGYATKKEKDAEAEANRTAVLEANKTRKENLLKAAEQYNKLVKSVGNLDDDGEKRPESKSGGKPRDLLYWLNYTPKAVGEGSGAFSTNIFKIGDLDDRESAGLLQSKYNDLVRAYGVKDADSLIDEAMGTEGKKSGIGGVVTTEADIDLAISNAVKNKEGIDAKKAVSWKDIIAAKPKSYVPKEDVNNVKALNAADDVATLLREYLTPDKTPGAITRYDDKVKEIFNRAGKNLAKREIAAPVGKKQTKKEDKQVLDQKAMEDAEFGEFATIPRNVQFGAGDFSRTPIVKPLEVASVTEEDGPSRQEIINANILNYPNSTDAINDRLSRILTEEDVRKSKPVVEAKDYQFLKQLLERTKKLPENDSNNRTIDNIENILERSRKYYNSKEYLNKILSR